MENKVIRPIIGISGSMTIEQDGIFSGYKRCYVSNDYIDSVVRAGAIPYVLPMVEDEEILKCQIDNVDALILTGGHDVNPLCFGEDPLCKIGEFLPARDTFDIKLTKLAIKDLAEGFKVIAKAKDGVIEAIEKEGEAFSIGVQWHPEMMSSKYENMQKIFNSLVSFLVRCSK